MAQSREVIYLKDFRGGLNLTTQEQSLEANQSPDCLNVDFGMRGGFMTRGGFQSQDYSSSYSGAQFLGSTYFGDDVVLLKASDGSLLSWDGATLVDSGFDITDTTDRVRMAVHSEYAYFSNCRSSGSIVMKRYDGSSIVNLGNSFNDTYASPAGGNMPLARHIVSHMGHMWVADTVESSTRHPHRVRFSHVQQPEDWATDDWFDLDPDDEGNPITALVKFQEVLLVFKRAGVFAVYGYDRDTFQVEKISDSSGTCTCGAAAGSSGVMYWFSTDGVLMGYNGRGVVPVTEGLRWWSDTGRIKQGGAHRLMWSGERLFMRLEAGAGEAVDYWLFVYDPRIGSLTRYDPVVSDMFKWNRIGEPGDMLFLFQSDNNLYKHDRSYSSDTVDSGSGPVSSRIEAYYRTSWITAGETATRKRWKRPRVTAAADSDTTLRVEVFHDFDNEQSFRVSEFLINTTEDSVWDTMVWGDTWSQGVDDRYGFRRMSSSGTGYAVQFKFFSNDNTGRWWVDSIALPFRRKQVR